MVDGIGGITNTQDALRAYATSNSQDSSGVKDGMAFQNVMKTEMNKFAGMTPQQILSHITTARRAAITDSVTISQSIGTLSSTLQTQEEVVRKSLSGKASLTDIMTASNDATNVLKTAVKIRDQVHSLIEKVFGMQI
ncbi:MAG: flagellar hook-basal body complex protein FliE [Pseudomonadota bacterium]